MSDRKPKEDEGGGALVARRDFLRRVGGYSAVAASILGGPFDGNARAGDDGAAPEGAPPGQALRGREGQLHIGERRRVRLDQCRQEIRFRIVVPQSMTAAHLAFIVKGCAARWRWLDAALVPHADEAEAAPDTETVIELGPGHHVVELRSSGESCWVGAALAVSAGDAREAAAAVPLAIEAAYADCAWEDWSNWANGYANSWSNAHINYGVWAQWMQNW